MSVPDSTIVPVAIARWRFAGIVTGAICIVAASVPTRHARNQYVDQALYTSPAVEAVRPTPSDKNASGNANKKK